MIRLVITLLAVAMLLTGTVLIRSYVRGDEELGSMAQIVGFLRDATNPPLARFALALLYGGLGLLVVAGLVGMLVGLSS